MSSENKKAPSIHLGTSSLLVVFLVLCLAVFAALSLSTARRDAKASEQLASRRTAYYEISNRAESLVQLIDNILQEEYDLHENWLREAMTRIEEFGQSMDSVSLAVGFQDDVPLVSWQLDLGNDQALAAELVLQEPDDNGRLYRITRWQTIPVSEWESSDTVQLMPFGK